jgi:hypothetical protein
MIRLVSRWAARRGDDGAYAILYAVLMVVILGVAALVIDVGMVRMDRRANRSATDAAAIAGAGALGLGGQNPAAACKAAMRYAEASIGVSTPGADNCATTFAGSPVALCTAGVPLTASETVGGRSIFVTWPVPDNSTYMTTPDLENWPGVPTSQPAQSGAAGPDGFSCSRVGVAIHQTANTLFGTGIGFGGRQGTESRSVAKTIAAAGKGKVAAPLVVLDPRACQALNASGGGTGGGVQVNASASFTLPDGTTSQTPGIIAIDSDGTQPNGAENGTSCSGGGTAISVSNNTRIWSLDSPSAFGFILSYALLTNNTAHAYSGNTSGCPVAGPWVPPVTGPPPNLCRIPQPGERVTDLPWLDRYDCGTTLYTRYTSAGFTCTEPDPPELPRPEPRDYVDQWQRYAQNVLNNAAFPTGTTDKIPGTAGGRTVDCNIGNDLTVTNNVLITCATLHIKSSAHVSFQGMVVAAGDLSVENSACVLLNDTDLTHCTALPPQVDPALAPPDGNNVFLGGGLSVDGGASFVDSQSFVFVTGQLNSNGGAAASSVVSWVGPYANTGTTCVPATSVTAAPTPGCFNSLAMWSPYQGTNTGSSQDFLTGGGNFNVDGTLFLGYSAFDYAGQAANLQTRAQLVTRIMNLTGGSLLNMTPDGSRSTKISVGAGQLIR